MDQSGMLNPHQNTTVHYKFEREITEPVMLCDPNGNLLPAAIGYSRQPLHTCNLSGHWPRKKKWNYWCVTSPEILFSITLSNIDYLGMVFAYFMDFSSNQFFEQTVSPLFGQGMFMPETVQESVHFDDAKMKVAFEEKESGVHITTHSPAFGGQALDVDLFVTRPEHHQTLNVVIPWSRERFQFTSKQNCLPVSGQVKLGERTWELRPQDSFACLDFGRGIWPYRGFWNWGSFSGLVGEHAVGVNMGGGWTDGTSLTENGLVCDGELFKLTEDIRFEYDPSHFMSPWTMKSTLTPAVDLKFVPFYERVACTDAVILRSEVHQMIGKYYGKLTPTGRSEILIDGITGWAEEHHARW
jgi:hypothetical protein